MRSWRRRISCSSASMRRDARRRSPKRWRGCSRRPLPARLAAITLRLSRRRLALEDVAVQGGVLLPLCRHVFLGEDGRDGALRFARAAIDALVRVDVQHVGPLVDAIHRAHVYTRAIFDVDARLGDHIRHLRFSERLSEYAKVESVLLQPILTRPDGPQPLPVAPSKPSVEIPVGIPTSRLGTSILAIVALIGIIDTDGYHPSTPQGGNALFAPRGRSAALRPARLRCGNLGRHLHTR